MGLDKTIRENKQVKKIEKKLSGWPRTVGAVPKQRKKRRISPCRRGQQSCGSGSVVVICIFWSEKSKYLRDRIYLSAHIYKYNL